ncbi:DUF6923 family protein [Jiangella asiatica]|uniref:LPXTG cell wall anchor domain-containing protein n=1 Tax=Jiangella asiatica TaxID=2530372 RepID=A0A4R5DBR4_9ACTN|nr:GEVED domain-containing protein [Jiangella asiatica]TDE11136.1 LPXTG cell wall anchor domain-containing protein [Jiangella asiatica]
MFERRPADVRAVDVATGESEVVAEDIWEHRTNALGYNPVDNYIYGSFDTDEDGSWEFGRVGSDFSVELLGLPEGWAEGPGEPWDESFDRVVADFTPDGHYWAMLRLDSGASWAEVDLDPASPDHMSVASSGDFDVPDGWDPGADWAYNVDDGKFYMVANRTDEHTEWGLLAFDPAAHTMSVAAEIGQLVGENGPLSGGTNTTLFGAMYSDADGYIYAAHSATGQIWRVDMASGEAVFHGRAAGDVTNTDGARCTTPEPEEPAQPFACGPGAPGYLFQGSPARVSSVDLVTGESQEVAEDFWPERTNGFGYNPLDDYLYGSFRVGDGDGWEFGRVGADFSVELLGLPDGWPETWNTSNQVIVGEFTDDGHYWGMLRGETSSSWVEIDLNPDSDTYFTVVDDGVVDHPEGWLPGSDWAIDVGDGNLYTLGHGTDEATEWALMRFDTTQHTLAVTAELGQLDDGDGPLTGDSVGAIYADADGFAYASHNSTGEIWRLDLSGGTAEFFAHGPGEVSTNDGARCAESGLPVDFGDAPDSYGTTVASDGARHSQLDGLTLGSIWDAETDAADDPAALDGANDDARGDADEDAVAGPIELSSAARSSTSVPVTVTNTTTEPATLAGWVDLDGDGTFGSDELRTAAVPAESGTATYELAWDGTGELASDSYARFRLFAGEVEEADVLPTGSAAGGEVEDHAVIPASDDGDEDGTDDGDEDGTDGGTDDGGTEDGGAEDGGAEDGGTEGGTDDGDGELPDTGAGVGGTVVLMVALLMLGSLAWVFRRRWLLGSGESV